MKVLVFNGSPRRGGNSQMLLDEAVRGAREQGAEVKMYTLNTMAIRPCQHCGGCERTGRCIVKDEMQAVHEEIRSAERFIVASPIFFFSVSAQTKILIDRAQSFWNEKYILKKPISPGASGRKGLLFLVGGMKQGEKNVGFTCAEATVRSFFRTISVQEHVTFSYDDVDVRGAIAKHPSALREAYEAGINLLS